MSAEGYDVLIVGASIAGCTAATLLARTGLRVALVEARPDIDSFKRPCGHFVQASATPILERLGVTAEIEEGGGVRNSVAIWSRRGWVHPNDNGATQHAHPPTRDTGHGYTIRREKLDPILRRCAAQTAGVDLMLGTTATEVSDEPGRPVKLTVSDKGGHTRQLEGSVLVAADGRNSTVGKLTGANARALPNRRFMYLAYYEDLPLAFGDTGQLWFCEPDMLYAYPTDDGLTLLACSIRKSNLATFKRNREANFQRSFKALPLAPQPEPSKRATPFIGKLDMTNFQRAPTHGRIAFIGDCALAPDPSWAVGCGWALRSAEWLADSLSDPLLRGDDLDDSLARYRRLHRSGLLPAFLIIASYSIARPMLPPERLLMRGAARDPALAETLHGFGAGTVPAWKLFTPGTLAKATWTSVRPQQQEHA
jgi:2-polyprenyl-6-methoxyphenol hydroxylase-like FAD-dependent oxidoreductase